jgi:hypothetical protein
MRKHSDPEVFRISGARTGLTEDIRGRQRRYIISMAIRTVSVILTVVLWNVERPLAWAMLVVGALLPYVAVVFANALLVVHPAGDASGDRAVPRGAVRRARTGTRSGTSRSGLTRARLAPPYGLDLWKRSRKLKKSSDQSCNSPSTGG